MAFIEPKFDTSAMLVEPDSPLIRVEASQAGVVIEVAFGCVPSESDQAARLFYESMPKYVQSSLELGITGNYVSLVVDFYEVVDFDRAAKRVQRFVQALEDRNYALTSQQWKAVNDAIA